MLTPYTKQHLSTDQQVAKLKHYGLVIHNENYAKKCLIQYNYYRLSAYWHIFRSPNPSNPYKKLSVFKPNCTFEKVIQLYEFDKNLRNLIFKAITEIETFLRTQIAYHLPSINNDAFAVYDISLFQNKQFCKHTDLIKSIDGDVERGSKEDFIEHYKTTYSAIQTANRQPQLPLWMLTEILSFGTLRKIYCGLKPIHKNKIVSCFNIKTSTTSNPLNIYHVIDFKDFDSYLFLINKYRNICAHHGRLWNRRVANVLKVNAANNLNITGHTHGGLYAILIVIARLMEPTGHAKEWKDSIYTLLKNNFPLDDICKYTTLPNNWHEHTVWK